MSVSQILETYLVDTPDPSSKDLKNMNLKSYLSGTDEEKRNMTVFKDRFAPMFPILTKTTIKSSLMNDRKTQSKISNHHKVGSHILTSMGPPRSTLHSEYDR